MDRYDHGRAQAQRSAVEQLKFITANIHYLQSARNGKKLIEAVHNFNQIVKGNGKLTENQLTFCDTIYEVVMEQAGLPGCSKRRSDFTGRNYR